MFRVASLMSGILAVLAVAPRSFAQGSEVPLETVQFEIDYVTTVGDSVFVLGDVVQLGDGDMTRAVKLVPGAYDPGPPASLMWSIDVAIPEGTTFNYSFVVRDDAVSQLSDPGNGVVLAGPFVGTTATPVPPARDLRFYKTNGGPASEVTFHLPAGDITRPLVLVPNHADLIVAHLTGAPNGVGTDATIAGNPVRTPLHTLLRRGGHIFNYVSDPAAATAGFRELFAVPTSQIVATRTIDSVTGRGIEVWLPRGYNEHTARRYPVLYMHDGQNVFEPGGAFGTWAAEVVAAELIKSGNVRELIIVAIDNSSNRLPEYNPDWSGSQNAAYNSFIVDELKPVIDARYRTKTGPADTGVMGSSFGGIASLSIGLDYPEVFGRVGAMSTSFWATDVDVRLDNGELPLATRLYLDAGDISDGGDDTIAVRDALLADGRVSSGDLFFQIGYGHQHNEAAWNDRLDEALLALFPITDEAVEIDLPVPVIGDVNNDGCVDLTDLAMLLSAFDACSGDAAYDANVDVDGSGCIDLTDLALVLSHFDEGCA